MFFFFPNVVFPLHLQYYYNSAQHMALSSLFLSLWSYRTLAERVEMEWGPIQPAVKTDGHPFNG